MSRQSKDTSLITIAQISMLLCILLATSISAIPSWDHLNQIAIADRLYHDNEMYPSPHQTKLGSVSVYFPGVSLLAYCLLHIVPSEHIVIVMLCIASLITFAAITLQKSITLYLAENYNDQNFWPVMIVFTTFVCGHWLAYAAEFKPDTFAYLLGTACILLKNKIEKNLFIDFFLGLIAGSALILKQQYITFIIGYFLFFLYTQRSKDIFFLVGMACSSALVMMAILNEKNALFWTISVLSDDGFLQPYEWIRNHLSFGLTCLISLLFLFLLHFHGSLNFSFYEFRFNISKYLNNPFTWLILTSCAAAFLSSWKVGGNSGNSAYGLFLLSPLVLMIFQNANRKMLFAFSIFAIIYNFPTVTNVQNRISEISTFKSVAEKIVDDNCEKTVIGSNLYFAIRDKISQCEYQDYWIHSRKANTDIFKGQEIKKFLSDPQYSLFIIEKFSINKQLISKNPDIELIFENGIGLIAVRKIISQ